MITLPQRPSAGSRKVDDLKGQIADDLGKDLRGTLSEKVTSSASRRIAGVNGLRREPGTVRSMVGNMLVADTAPKKPARMNDPEYLLSNDGLHGNLTDRSIWAPDSTPQGQRRLRGMRGSGLEIDPTSVAKPKSSKPAYTGIVPEYVAPEAVKETRDYGSIQADDADGLSNAPMSDPQYRMSGYPGSIPDVDLGRDLKQDSIASPASQRPEPPETQESGSPIDTLAFSGYDPDIDYRGLAAEQSSDENASRPLDLGDKISNPKHDLTHYNYFGDEIDESGFGYLFDPQDAMIGNTRSNDMYIRDAAANGASDEELRAIMNDPSLRDKALDWLNGLGEWFASSGRAANAVNQAKWMQPDQVELPEYDLLDMPADALTTVDDGTYDYAHMTSNQMTGTQYRHYVEMGIPGRPIEEIDPTRTYNKRAEMLDYGFTPFTPDAESMWRMGVQNVVEMPGRIKGAVSNARTLFTPDYRISYGGNSSFSGKDFDRRSMPYFNEIAHQEHLDPYAHINGGDGMSPNIVEFSIPDGSGGTRYAHGAFTGIEGPNLFVTFEDGQTIEVSSDEYSSWSANADGHLEVPEEYWRAHGQPTGVDSEPDGVYLTFTDGQRIGIPAEDVGLITDDEGMLDIDANLVTVPEAHGSLPDDLGSLNDMDYIMSSAEANGDSPLHYAGVQYYPDLVLSDGTTIPYADAERLYRDRTLWDDPDDSSDDDISYEFMPLNLNAPRRLLESEAFKENPDGGFLPAINGDYFKGGGWYLNPLDWTLGSIPISLPGNLPFIGTVSDASLSLRGIDPATYDPDTNSYGLIGGYYDDGGNLRYGITDRYGNVDDARSDQMRLWNAAGNALVPFTERIAGNVGSEPIAKGLYNLFGIGDMPFNPSLAQYLGYTLKDINGEGVEEIIGNPFEEMTSYGPDMYSSPVYDANGDPLTDITGREIRDYGTPNIDRLHNALDPMDAANAYMGGAAVSLMMNALPFPSPSDSLVPSLYRSARKSAAQRNGSVAPYVPADQVVVPRLQARFIDQFEDEYGRDDIDDSVSDAFDEYTDMNNGRLVR